jgi:heat shock protein HslJ
MKHHYYIGACIGLVVGLATTSCSLLDKTQKFVVRGSDGKVSDTTAALASTSSSTPSNAATTPSTSTTITGPVLTPPSASKQSASATKKSEKTSASKAVKNSKKKASNKSQTVTQAELAEARRDIKEQTVELSVSAGDTLGVTTVDDNNNAGVDQLNANAANALINFTINGEWTIYSVRGNVVTGEERPYINFDLDANRFYGSNGCNIVNGDLQMAGEDSRELKMTNVISTMQTCADAPFEYLINLAIADVKAYSVRQDGSITFLALQGTDGHEVMVLRRHNMDFLNGAWTILSINGEQWTQENKATMTINIPDLKIHGTTGCNLFNGSLFIDPDKVHSMQFLDIATTRRACPADSRETELLLALECVETARSTGDDTIAMFDTEGNELFTMQRIELHQEN